MKIAIDVSQMCYEGTGVARYVYGLVQALLNLDTKHKFVLYAGSLRQRAYFEKLKTQSPWDKARWHILPIPPKLASIALNALPIPIESLIGKVDLFHSSDWVEPRVRCPHVTTVHDLVFVKYPETVAHLIVKAQTKRLKRVVNGNGLIIADSKSTKNDLMETYSLSTERIEVVYPGIDSSYKPASSTDIERVKTKYNLPNNYIFSLGTQEPRKNLTRLESAALSLNLPLVIAGKHGWGSKTTTLGFVPESDLPALYTGATVFAYPSLYEGFGFPVLEAMACGTPVVTSNISSLPELAGDAAILVDPSSIDLIKAGITTAIQNRDICIERGFKQVQKFTWESTARHTMEVYEKTANRH
ncbi:MAG: glycosyltransferase family 1 protein [Microgenomates group bacterium]